MLEDLDLPEKNNIQMKIIVPMAGMGKRMRPHTLTVPKPLLPIAGKPIVQRLVEDIAGVCGEKVEEIAFIIGDFGAEVETSLKKIAADLGAKGSIYHQDEALGTAHAIYCAEQSLDGKVIVAFADTLFTTEFTLDTESDGIIWVKQIDDPRQFGVVKLNDNNEITDFVEKPETFVSDLAIIGIYYFKDGGALKKEIKYLLDNNIKDKGEFQLTDALENLKSKGAKFKPGKVDQWMDCGNKNVTVQTNTQVLENNKDKNWVASNVKKENAIIIPPCYIGENVVLKNTVVGPYVSLGDNSNLENCVIKNSIIQTNSRLVGAVLENSMVGNFVDLEEEAKQISIGDYSTSGN